MYWKIKIFVIVTLRISFYHRSLKFDESQNLLYWDGLSSKNAYKYFYFDINLKWWLAIQNLTETINESNILPVFMFTFNLINTLFRQTTLINSDIKISSAIYVRNKIKHLAFLIYKDYFTEISWNFNMYEKEFYKVQVSM